MGFSSTHGCGFGGGWIGAWGFRLAQRTVPTTLSSHRPTPQPEFRIGFYDHVLRRHGGQWWLESLTNIDDHREVVADVIDTIDAHRGQVLSEPYHLGGFAMVPGAEAHRRAVSHALDWLHADDLFQVNLAARLESTLTGDPLDVFCRGVDRLAPAYAAYISDEEGAIVSFSPELFVRRLGRNILSSPIKGTAALDCDPAELVSSAKDNAENAMIADLMRNDLSAVCVPGSVRAPSLARLERHGLWHLVSDVVGRLRHDVTDGQLLASTFPPGSITGAPKSRAIELIDELEATSREAYTGAIGYVSPTAGTELNVAIRTFETDGSTMWIGAGGGIVADSSPEDELAECWVKAQPLIEAISTADVVEDAISTTRSTEQTSLEQTSLEKTETIGNAAGERHTRTSTATPVNYIERAPESAHHVFETIRVEDQIPLNLNAHLFRLEQSALMLYNQRLPPDTAEQITSSAAKATRVCRLRAEAGPVDGQLRVEVTMQQLDDDVTSSVLETESMQAWHLIPRTIRSGLGEHKWADRRRLEPLPDAGQELLVLDVDQSVLEGGRSNLFIADAHGLTTPRLDGRILPGTMRDLVIDIANNAGVPVREARLDASAMQQATEVFVTNALRGIVPISKAQGIGQWSTGPMTQWLARAVREKACSSPPVVASSAFRVALLHEDDPFIDNLADVLRSLGAAVDVMNNDVADAAELARQLNAQKVTHLIVASRCEQAPAVTQALQELALQEPALQKLAPMTPILGLGDGYMSVARALGATALSSSEVVHGKRVELHHDGQGVYRGLTTPLNGGLYDASITDESALPASLAVTARCHFGSVMGLRHEKYPVEAMRIRPDSILTGEGHRMLDNFLALGDRLKLV